MYIWTKEEIEKILIQLDEREYPSAKYRLSRRGQELELLGKGSTAYVYRGEIHSGLRSKACAIKVIGFTDSHLDREQFAQGAEAYKQLSLFRDNIIRLYDYSQLLIQLDEDNRVLRVETTGGQSEVMPEPAPRKTDRLLLQFLVLELAEPVYAAGTLYPEALQRYEQKEILKCAYEIGQALKDTHAAHMLHRDVKLENIFYSPEKKQYKLGDFGIARVTEDGMASSIAMTKGYGAPEVVRERDLYDNTADIYSYGMMLYLLWNHLRFPDSEGYYSNFSRQYCDGYVLPRPDGGSDELYKILKKMCAYDPGDRYQSMDEVFTALDRIWYPVKTSYRREHSRIYLLLGTVAMYAGLIAGKIAFPQIRTPATTGITCFLYAFVCVRALLGAGRARPKGADSWFTLGILGGMIAVFVKTGFHWGSLLLYLWFALDSGLLPGLVSGAALSLILTDYLQRLDAGVLPTGDRVGWLMLLLLPIAVLLLMQYAYLTLPAADKTWSRTGMLVVWIVAALLYLELTLSGIAGWTLWGIPTGTAGICGLAFLTVWFLREKYLVSRGV